MKTDRTPRDIDECIAGFPRAVQRILKRVRSTIRKAVPGAEEVISYEIPTYKLHGRPVSFRRGRLGAGIAFDLTGAALSHAALGDPAGKALARADPGGQLWKVASAT